MRKKVVMTLLGVVAFYVLALAGTFAVVWHNAAHKTESLLDYAEEDLSSTVDWLVDAVLVNVGVMLVDQFGSAYPVSGDEMQRLAKTCNVDEINIVRRDGVIVASSDAVNLGVAMARRSAETAAFMVLTNGQTSVFSQNFRPSAADDTVVLKYLGVPFPQGNGFVQIGFDERRLERSFDQMVGGLLPGWRIGEWGFYLCADRVFSRVTTPVQGHPEIVGVPLMNLGINLFDIPREGDRTFVAKIFGAPCFCRHFTYGRHRLLCVLPAEEFYGPALQSVLVAAAVLLVVFCVFGYVIGRIVTQQRRIDLLRRAEDERRERDLAVAKTIQLSALPVVCPDRTAKDYRIFAKMLAAREVGGDFYDFHVLPEGRVLFLVADVSGKGVPAALFMMRAKAIIRAAVYERPGDLAGAIGIANENLSDNNEAEMFVTAWVGVYERRTGEVRFVNAGHNPPLIKRADGSVEWLRERGGMALAAMGGVSYREHVCRLGPGDSIFLYTDGVTEAMNTANELYGEERMEKALKRASRQFVTDVEASVAAFAVGAVQSDDITMLALDRLAET